jgi:hypothetical protein
MPQVIDELRSPWGLSGGTILSGSVSIASDAFWYLPVTATSASIAFSNLVGGSINTSFTANAGVYGAITSVTQSSGIAVLYSGSYIAGIPGR